MNRRGFLGSLFAAPAALLAKPEPPADEQVMETLAASPDRAVIRYRAIGAAATSQNWEITFIPMGDK